MRNFKKKALTLIEIMVVIALIGIIGSVLGVNMKKSMDKAKAFKDQAHKQKIVDTLMMEYATENKLPKDIIADAAAILVRSGLFKDDAKVLLDASGQPIRISFDKNKGEFVCH